MSVSTHPRGASRRAARLGVESLESRELRAGGLAHAASLVGPVVSPPKVIFNPPPLPADLALTGINIQSLGGDQYKVTATLRDGPTPVLLAAVTATGANVIKPPVWGVAAYPGGGVLRLTRTSGGTVLNSQSPYNPLATPDPVQVLASVPIPHLDPGQTIQVSAVTTGRAVFTAAAVPTFGSVFRRFDPLPEVNKANDSRTVSNLIPHTYDINTLTLNLLPSLRNALQGTQIRLDSGDSYVVVPGFLDKHFTIPSKTVSIGVGPFSVGVTYSVNNLTSSGVTLSYEEGGLALTVKFADNQHALHTPSSLAPDISVKNLQVKVLLPLSYGAADQYFLFGNPKVTVTGSWHANGPLGSVFDLLIPDLNQKASAALTSAIKSNLGALSYGLTSQVHNFLNGGRIVSAQVGQDDLMMRTETPN